MIDYDAPHELNSMSKSEEDNYYCFFVDHTFFDVKTIANIYTYHLNGFSNQDKNDYAILSTCQRIELYTREDKNILSHFNLPFIKISGKKNIINRLTLIAAGVFSQILGESNIMQQVTLVKDELYEGHLFKEIFSGAIERSQECRKKYSFNSSLNYQDFAINLLNDNSVYKRETKNNLVVIGSGMLALGFLDNKKIDTYYNDLYFVTRAHKSLKKRLKNLDSRVTGKSCNVENPDLIQFLPSSYHCIIATIDITEEYKNKILPILTSKSCNGLFELSAAPVFHEHEHEHERLKIYYSNTYENDYKSMVDFHNKDLTPASKNIIDDIEGG